MVSAAPPIARREVALAPPQEPKKSGKDEGLTSEVRELFNLVVTYAKQQTLDPLKNLLRWVAYGVAGAILIGLGFLMIGLGLLRAIQSEGGKHLRGDWSWVPYLVTVVFLGAVIGFMVTRISRGPASHPDSKEER
jgi:hypothetical protein